MAVKDELEQLYVTVKITAIVTGSLIMTYTAPLTDLLKGFILGVLTVLYLLLLALNFFSKTSLLHKPEAVQEEHALGIKKGKLTSMLKDFLSDSDWTELIKVIIIIVLT